MGILLAHRNRLWGRPQACIDLRKQWKTFSPLMKFPVREGYNFPPFTTGTNYYCPVPTVLCVLQWEQVWKKCVSFVAYVVRYVFAGEKHSLQPKWAQRLERSGCRELYFNVSRILHSFKTSVFMWFLNMSPKLRLPRQTHLQIGLHCVTI